VLGANLGFHGHAFGGERGVLFCCCCCEEANKGSGTRERKRDKVVEYYDDDNEDDINLKHSWQSEGEEERASKLVKMEETLIASMRDARSSGERKSTRGGGGQRKKKIGATNAR
jgi:hypothetical protein